MKPILAALLLTLLTGFAYCSRHHNPQSAILGQYELAGYDDAGRLVFTGTISLMSLEQNHLKGRCTIARGEYAPEGLLEKDGGCEGLMDGKQVSIDLAPFLDDAGLLLEGPFDGERMSGTWMLDGFATSRPLGKFEAVKKE